MAPTDDRVRELLQRFGRDDISLASLLCDDHAPGDVAFTIVDADLERRDLTYGELAALSMSFASGLASLGVGRGDHVAVLMGKSAELVVALTAIWRLGAIHVPLFTAFAPAAIALRLGASAASVIVVDSDQRAKLDPSDDMPERAPWRVVTAGDEPRAGDVPFDDLLANPPMTERTEADSRAPFITIFTSGTTGMPKGVPVPARALAHMASYMEFGLDLRPEDVFWNAADPGWAYGLYYAIVGPMAMGRRSILLRSGFTPALTWRVLSELEVSNFAAAPTVYRVLRNEPSDRRVRLRCASSAGEPLSPDLIEWSEDLLGVPIRDHYGQTELGMVIANGWHPAVRREITPGSMGRALPGHEVVVLHDERDEPVEAGTTGRVVVDTTAPLFAFPGYLDDEEKTAERLTADGRWYITGDRAAMEDGDLFFSSRDDDVIIMAGYRIGPFEVESVLVTHAEVLEAAAIGVPDDLRGEVIEAFVVLHPESDASATLEQDLQALVKAGFAAHAYPRRVHFVDALPKTPSGKIQRFLLREQRRQELGGAVTTD